MNSAATVIRGGCIPRRSSCRILLLPVRVRYEIPYISLLKYKIKDITDKIIKPAIREINWNNSFGREINYETVRSGRNVAGYRFFFEANSLDKDSPF